MHLKQNLNSNKEYLIAPRILQHNTLSLLVVNCEFLWRYQQGDAHGAKYNRYKLLLRLLSNGPFHLLHPVPPKIGAL